MRAAAARPAEDRGLARDGVRMLVATADGLAHATFGDLPHFLNPGDLLVVNTSATLAAAVDGHRADGRPVTVHFSTPLEDRSWLVELRTAAPDLGKVTDASACESIALPGGKSARLLYRYPRPDSDRMWAAQIAGPGSCRPSVGAGGRIAESGAGLPSAAASPTAEVLAYLARHGRPIRYSYVPDPWPLPVYQTVFSREPGSAEMPSAARPFTERLVTDLVAAGVIVAPITLHTGVGSLEAGEQPLPERFRVPEPTAALVRLTRAAGRRVVAVGTTVTRALESAADADGEVWPSEGWTALVLGAARPARVVGGIVTGWHDPEASHLALLEAVAGHRLVEAAYAEAERAGYLGHEFGDSCLLLPPLPPR